MTDSKTIDCPLCRNGFPAMAPMVFHLTDDHTDKEKEQWKREMGDSTSSYNTNNE